MGRREVHHDGAILAALRDLWTVIAHAGRRLARTSDFVRMDFLLKVTVATLELMDVTDAHSAVENFFGIIVPLLKNAVAFAKFEDVHAVVRP